MSRTYRIRHGDMTRKYYMVIDWTSVSPGETPMDEFVHRQSFGYRSFWRIHGASTIDEYNKAAKAICSTDGQFAIGGNAGPWYYRNQFHRKFRRRARREIHRYMSGIVDDVPLTKEVFSGYYW